MIEIIKRRFDKIILVKMEKLFSLQVLFITTVITILIFSVTLLFYFIKSILQLSHEPQEISVSGYKSFLILSVGKLAYIVTIICAKKIVLQSKLLIVRKLIYQNVQNYIICNFYNFFSMPVGRQYYVVVNDRTKVWLNAQSGIKYPILFNGVNRLVERKGYFEFAYNAPARFKMVSKSQVVEVSGTHLNISAYADINKATLIVDMFSIHCNNSESNFIIEPNNQCLLKARKEEYLQKIKTVDIDEAIAWKTGLFKFDGKRFKTILEKLLRWYDVEIKFENADAEKQKFSGTLSQISKIKTQLIKLECRSVEDFTIKGRRFNASI